jgi:hypothetical protein
MTGMVTNDSHPPARHATWNPITWAVIGFAGGALIAAPLVLSADLNDPIGGGMIFGGIPGALLGLGHGGAVVGRRTTAAKTAGS